jgi:hypothetical protein
MRSAAAKIPDTRMTNRFRQPSNFTLSIKTEEVIQLSCGVRADDGSYALAEVASEAGG